MAMGRSRGGMTPKIHAVVDTKAAATRSYDEAHDNRLCSVLLNQLSPQTLLLVRVDHVCSSLARAAHPLQCFRCVLSATFGRSDE
jgi:hypothetical protein